MSVRGLMLWLTQRLIRTMSAQAVGDITTSRASVGFVAHSRLFSVQNSIQPIGAREALPSEMNIGRSLAAAGAASAASRAVAAHAVPTTFLKFLCIPAAPSQSVGPLFSQSF